MLKCHLLLLLLLVSHVDPAARACLCVCVWRLDNELDTIGLMQMRQVVVEGGRRPD